MRMGSAWLVIAAAMFAPPALAESLYEGGPVAVPESSIEWQKVDLEERLQEKIRAGIAPALPEGTFVVNVALRLKAQPGAAPGEAGERPPLGKLDLATPDYAGPDAMNVFRNIEGIAVTVLLDESVSENKRAIVETVVKSVAATVTTAAPEIKLEQVELAAAEAPWSFRRWLIELRLPLAALAATLLASFFLLVMFRGYRGLETRKIAIMESRDTREASAAEAAKEATEREAAGTEVKAEEEVLAAEEELAIEGQERGFEKFRSLAKNAPDKAGALVRQWIKAPARGAPEALAVLPRVISSDDLLKISESLSADDRREWKRHLATRLDKRGAALADLFVSSQIVESLLIPAHAVDDELKGMLASLTLTECVEVALKDPGFGALLANLLPTRQVARIFALMPAENANAITTSSLKFSDEELAARSPGLKESIRELKAAKEKGAAAPFLDRTADLLREVGPDKEGSIFAALAESGELKLLEAAARQFFPAELLVKLPAKLLRSCLERLPVRKRADVIFSRSPEERAVLLDAFGKEGTKVRDIIDVEVKQIEGDDLRKRKIAKTQAELWSEFADAARALIRGSEQAADSAEAVLGAWLSEKTGGKIGGGQDASTQAA